MVVVFGAGLACTSVESSVCTIGSRRMWLVFRRELQRATLGWQAVVFWRNSDHGQSSVIRFFHKSLSPGDSYARGSWADLGFSQQGWKTHGRSSICYLTVLKCQLPPSTYAPPAVAITRLNALLFSPTIQEHVRYFCRMHEQAEQNAELRGWRRSSTTTSKPTTADEDVSKVHSI
jgi:hypothetical protein